MKASLRLMLFSDKEHYLKDVFNLNRIKRYQSLSMAWLIYLLMITIYPSIRLLIMGHRTSATLTEQLFSLLPEFFTLTFAIIAFLLTASRPVSILKQKTFNLFWPDIVVGLYVLLLIALGSIHIFDTIAFFHEIRLAFFPVIFYLVFRILTSNEIKQLLYILMWWLFGLSLVANLLYLLSQDVFLKIYVFFDIPTWEYIILRLSFLIWSPVVFGSLMSMGLLLSLFFVQKPLTRILLLMFFSTSLTLTMSRGAILSIMMALIFIAFVSKKLRITSLTYLGIFIVIFFLLSFVLTQSLDLPTWTFSSSKQLVQGSSRETRDVSYSQIIHDVHHSIIYPNENTFFTREKILFGSGFGTAGHVGLRYHEKHRLYLYKATMDGYYLKIYVETGLIGLVIFFLCMGYLFIWFMRLFLREKNLSYLLPAVLLFYTLAQNLVSNTMDFYFYSYLFWAILGSFKTNSYE